MLLNKRLKMCYCPHYMTSFRDRVYEILRQVPKGKVVTYGQLGMLAGRPKAARAVGMFMASNPDAPHTPCHRVVASDGSLHGYSAGEGIPTKKVMLQKEGVVFRGNKVDLGASRWQTFGLDMILSER